MLPTDARRSRGRIRTALAATVLLLAAGPATSLGALPASADAPSAHSAHSASPSPSAAGGVHPDAWTVRDFVFQTDWKHSAYHVLSVLVQRMDDSVVGCFPLSVEGIAPGGSGVNDWQRTIARVPRTAQLKVASYDDRSCGRGHLYGGSRGVIRADGFTDSWTVYAFRPPQGWS